MTPPDTAAAPSLADSLRRAIGDPGSIVLRRGLNRDGTPDERPLERIVSWQLGAVVNVVKAHIQTLIDSGPGDDCPHVWEALHDLMADFQEADNGR